MGALETKANTLFEKIKLFTQENDLLRELGEHGISFNVSPQLTFSEMNQDETKFRQIVVKYEMITARPDGARKRWNRRKKASR